jgi:hypothetical protein
MRAIYSPHCDMTNSESSIVIHFISLLYQTIVPDISAHKRKNVM